MTELEQVFLTQTALAERLLQNINTARQRRDSDGIGSAMPHSRQDGRAVMPAFSGHLNAAAEISLPFLRIPAAEAEAVHGDMQAAVPLPLAPSGIRPLEDAVMPLTGVQGSAGPEKAVPASAFSERAAFPAAAQLSDSARALSRIYEQDARRFSSEEMIEC